MKILAIIKRFSSNKDQILENFGREVRLFSELQKRGHDVTLLCADHRKKERLTTKLNGMKVEIYPFTLPRIAKFVAAAKRMAAENDVVAGTSHPLFGYIALLAAAGKKPVVYDVRDNYETYDLTNIPLLKKGPAIRLVNNRVIKNSSLVTCASNLLAEMVRQKGQNAVTVIPNGIDLNLYKPLPKEKCRKQLGIPLTGKIITYSGGIRGAGVDLLIKAFNKLQEENLKLMLIGDDIKRKYAEAAEKSAGKIEVVSSMPYGKLLYYLNASDVLVVAYEKNDFTKVMYAPYKLMDYMALNKPIVCTDVGEMRKMLADDKLVCSPNDAEDMATKLMAALKIKKVEHRKKLAGFTWQKLGEKLDKAIMATFKNAAEVSR